MAYVLEPITDEDLLKILMDAKSNPDLDRGLQYDLRERRIPLKWVIDRENNSYLLSVPRFTNPMFCLDGYMFLYQGTAFCIYLNWLTHRVSLDRDFKSEPPKDHGFQRALSEACNISKKGRLFGKVIFNAEQSDKEQNE
ncbi:MAG: hypothetical protein LBU53_04215 [Zoogloeaceae bacterium]|jgi:hypothetical protein|nr:hypothetical protein [Zoogloeaceae bacterium]